VNLEVTASQEVSSTVLCRPYGYIQPCSCRINSGLIVAQRSLQSQVAKLGGKCCRWPRELCWLARCKR